jgi:hypothetical protein
MYIDLFDLCGGQAFGALGLRLGRIYYDTRLGTGLNCQGQERNTDYPKNISRLHRMFSLLLTTINSFLQDQQKL